MTKQKNQETNNVSFDTSSIRNLFQSAKAHRVSVSKSDGSELVNVNLLVAAIVTLIMPELVAIGVLVLFLTEGKVALIRPEETVNDEVQSVNA